MSASNTPNKQRNPMPTREDQTIEEWNRLISLEPSSDKPLFHYTTLAGLVGILEDNSLRASNVRYMNDASEFLHGKDQLTEYLVSLGVPDAAMAEAFRISTQKALDSTDRYPAYVFCLSEEPDQLTQWRAYGSGAGFSIEFDPAGLRELSIASPQAAPPVKLGAALYQAQHKAEHSRRVAKALIEQGSNLGNSLNDNENSNLLAFYLYVLWTLARFKHQAFESEKEHRLVCFPVANEPHLVDFCLRGNQLIVPYCTLKPPEGKKLPIKSIRIGPQRHPELAAKSVELLLGKHQFHSMQIHFSAIPLR